MALEAVRANPDSQITSPKALPPAGAREPVLFADAAEAADLLGSADAVAPLAHLCLTPEAQTPFLLGLVGPSGSGKSFALKRLGASIEALAAAAGKTPSSPLLSKIVIAPLDGAGVSGDPASALAAAAFAALERDSNGAQYSALADEAAHATTDPRRAAVTAAERHDEISRRLEAERGARDEIEAKRARLSEALLYETPGSRIDSFIRTSRATIDGRMRRFGLADGDVVANYRDLVRDLSSLGAGSRLGLVLRSMWAYRGQILLLLIALVAFLAAYGVDRLRAPGADAMIKGLHDQLAPVADWIGSHGEPLERAVEALIVIGLVALFVNLWRALGFSSLLFRGLRLLNLDVRDRRRELDASAARLDRRLTALSAEADAASKRADSLAKRAGSGGAASLARAPGPVFLKSQESPTRAAREFFAELGRLMSAANPTTPAPKRLIFVIDNLSSLPAGEGARLVEAAKALLGPGCVALIACDPATLAPSRPGWAGQVFQATFDTSVLAKTDGGRLAARLLSGAGPAPLAPEPNATESPLSEPLSASETALLTALAPLTGGTPRAVKRFHNAYRLARLAKAPRPAIALALAARMSLDAEVATHLRAQIDAEGEKVEDPAGPAALIAALQSTRGALGGPIAKSDAAAAWDAARPYA